MSAVAESVPSLSRAVADFLRQPRQMLIDGQWVQAESGKTFDVIDPATTNVIGQVAEGDAADVDKAVKAARKAFESGPWPRMAPHERGRLLHKVGDLILENLDILAELESLDNGKPITVARAADVPLAADMFHYMSGWCTKRHGYTIPLNVLYDPDAQYHVYTRKEPVGVVGQIIPWNFPLLMAAWKLAPALTMGCTVILKVAEETPLSAIRLGEILQEAGIPDGVVNIITGYGHTAGAHLANHTGIDKVAFTGSTEVGRKIVQASANDLKKVSLELGGKSPNIVLADADIDTAVAGAANAIFFNHGQCCAAGSRLFVQEKIYDKVIEGVAEQAKKIKLGPGLDPDTEMGPVVSQDQHQRISEYLDIGDQEGARRLSANNRPRDSQGYFIEPTILADAKPGMRVVEEEIFGPVVAAMPFKDMDDDLVKQANNSIYGLAAGIWTRDVSKAHKLASRLQAGSVWINCYNIFNSALPFGGYKQSGWGREMGEAVLDNYTEEKAVTVRLG